MRPGRSLDIKIAIKVLGLKTIEPTDIPYYSTEIFDAHKVISKLQSIGWLCNVSSRISNDGNLYYRAKFYQKGRECEKIDKSIPMAICMAALSIINNDYFDYVDVLKKQDSNPMEVVGENESSYFITNINDKDLVDTINDAINANTTNIAENVIDKLHDMGYIILKTK